MTILDERFAERYAKLNDRQKEAVDSIDGPVMVVAGPGTGKTTILTLRIANILRLTDTPASGILAITYTEEGAKNMRSKLREIIGSRADEVRIHTFHGFASSVISEFDDHFPHLSRSKQMTEVEAEEVMREILKEKGFENLRPLGDPDFYIKKILSAISESKREAWTPEMVDKFARDEAERIKGDEASISTRGSSKGQLKADAVKRIEKCERTSLFAKAYAAYEEKKREGKKMDYDDLIFELLLALRSDELLLRQLQEKFLYILVDEHQDTNDSQNAIIRAVAEFFDDPNLFVVGDEKQAIYRFQGASVENFLRFQDIWRSMKVIPLEANYRSHQAILDAAFSLIEHNYGDGAHENLRVRLVAGGKEAPRPIDVISAGNVEAAEAYLADELRSLVPDKTAAVIVRTNRDAARIASLLDAEGIPASSERSVDIFSHPIGLLFFELAAYLADPSQIESLAYTIGGGLWDLDFQSRANLIRDLRAGKSEEASEAIPALVGLLEEVRRPGAASFILHAAERSGLVRIAAQDPLSIEIWRGIVALGNETAARGSIEDPRALLQALISYKASAETKGVKLKSGDPDARVRIMTAHSSKGLEFDHVFIMYATEESWMSRNRASYFILPRSKGEGDEILDSRRLFYVALTRARSCASIIVPSIDADGKNLTPLRFISELDPGCISTAEIGAKQGQALSPKTGRGGDARRRSALEYAKRSLAEGGLSVTALNHFVRCPNLFYFKSVLKIPEAPSPSSEKGVAMHQAVAGVWRSGDKSADGIRQTIESEVRDYMSGSLLPLRDKERILAELAGDAPIVAEALRGHFSQRGEVSTERWFEAPYPARVGGNEIEIRLHGRLDAVLAGEDQVSVFDYKTREGMTEAEIRGETKATEDGKGAYFRQLAFYSLLLESNPMFKGKRIVPSLVFIRPDKKGRCPIVTLPVLKDDIEKVKSEIRSLAEAVWNGSLLDARCSDEKCEWCALNSLNSI